MTEYIYTLSCPETGLVMYVGKCNRINYRYNQHVTDFRDTAPIKEWIKLLVSKGLRPIMEVLEECYNHEGNNVEGYWICQFKVWGFPLLNRKAVFVGTYNHSKDTKNKITKSLTGKKVSQSTKEKLGRKVCKYGMNGDYLETYVSEIEAYRMNNFKFGIRYAIKNDRTAGGFRWRWMNDAYKNSIGKYNPPIIDASKASEARKRPIIEVDKNGVELASFAYINEAEEKTGLNNISAVCRGIRKHTQGRYFKYKTLK